MSKIKVNSIEAATGSTITIPSGQTLDISSTTLTLPSTVVTTTGTQTLTNKTIGVSQLSGTLPVANGGTGLTTLGTAEQVLRVNSGATALEFGTVSSYTDTDALDLFNASGSAPVYACRAWVNFNGQGTVAIREDGNVTSITDNGVGDYTINFTTAMPDANYSCVGSSGEDEAGTLPDHQGFQIFRSLPLTTSIRVATTNTAGGAADHIIVCAAFFR